MESGLAGLGGEVGVSVEGLHELADYGVVAGFCGKVERGVAGRVLDIGVGVEFVENCDQVREGEEGGVVECCPMGGVETVDVDVEGFEEEFQENRVVVNDGFVESLLGSFLGDKFVVMN